jgi:hypothetical protein
VYDDLFDDSNSINSDSDDDDSLDLEQLINDVQNSTSENAASDENASDDADDDDVFELKLTGEGGGAVLNYESDTEDPKKSNTKVIAGEKLRLIPNPGEGKALKQGGLVAVYKVKENDKEVTKTVVINADEKGRYLFTVPEDIILTAGLTIKAEFVDSGSSNAEADTTQTQLTGAIAVVVADNYVPCIKDISITVKGNKLFTTLCIINNKFTFYLISIKNMKWAVKVV